jgi:argininosuccinate lyase
MRTCGENQSLSTLVVESLKKDLIHEGRLGRFENSAARYTSSIDFDQEILDAVVRVNSAHVVSLAKSGILEQDVASSLLGALGKVPLNLDLDPELEDVHSVVEHYVTHLVGKEKGGMLNLAKSRNDQVATAIRIALRSKLLSLGKDLTKLGETLARRAEENAGVLMPGYTHLQRAQPVTVGHHLLAYEEMLERSSERILQCYARVNTSPMGAGALASSGFNPNRKEIASLLGFAGLVENSLDAVSARDFAIETIYICAQIMNDLSRLAEELIIWTSSEFSFARIPDAYASTSSMMPQKKNAIVPEIERARSAQVSGDLVAALGITKALPLSYNLDLQELTKNLWSAVNKTMDTVSIFSEMIEGLEFDKDALSKALEDETIFSTEIADYLVRKFRVPFRSAHQRVGALVRESKEKNAFSSLDESQIQKFLGVPISKEEIDKLLDAKIVLSRRSTVGSPNPSLVERASKRSLIASSVTLRKLERLAASLTKAETNLANEIDLIMKRKTGR